MAELPSASLAESVQFNQLVILPNAVQGLFRRRRTPVAVATKTGVDGHAVGLMSRLRSSHGPGPLWIRVLRDRALLMLEVEDIRRVLEGSPDPFASDPSAKRRGIAHFQPDALTISRGELWAERRRFAESVLDSAKAAHRLADRFVAVTAEEIGIVIDEVERDSDGVLGYDDWHRGFRRIVRRIVLGDAAREDEQLSDLLGRMMSEANGLPSERSEHLAPFMERLGEHVARAEKGSLASLFARAPAAEDSPAAGQAIHWLFATQDTDSANALRALALICAHPEQRALVDGELGRAGADELASGKGVAGLSHLRACISEAMRLYTTTPLLSRETLVELSWRGAVVPAGTQILIFNAFHHRDRERVEYADRFAPEEWIDGDAGEDWGFNHFSHGPQGCPGANLALLVASSALATMLTERSVTWRGGTFDPSKPLPHMLDYFGLEFELSAAV